MPARPPYFIRIFFSVFLLFPSTCKTYISLLLQSIFYGHVKTNCSYEFMRMLVLTKTWKVLIIVEEIELITTSDGQIQIKFIGQKKQVAGLNEKNVHCWCSLALLDQSIGNRVFWGLCVLRVFYPTDALSGLA